MAYVWAVVSIMALTLHQVLAQSILDFPQCAGKAALSSISSTGCQLTDIECICKDQSLIDSLIPNVKHKCSPEDFQKTVNVTVGLCDKAGVTITVSDSAPTALPSTPTVSGSTPSVHIPTPTVPTSPPTVPPSIPADLPPTRTINSTAKPRVIPTLTIFSKIVTHTSSVAPFRNSTSSKPTGPPNTTVNPTPKASPFTGAANRNSAAYVWAATFLGTIFLLLL